MTGRSDAIVLFGATGDLARRRLFPALYQLAVHDRLPARVVGVARSLTNTEALVERARNALEEFGPSHLDDAVFARLESALRYVRGDYADAATFEDLHVALAGSEHPLLYLAVPPSQFQPVIDGLTGAGIPGGARVVVEKPLGRDLESARALNERLTAAFAESDIFRIDHFLGKEEVLDLIVFRLANTFLDPAWNRHYIDNVQITMAESYGLEGRGAFYDEVGALGDVVQNHLLQLVALIAMEPPVSAEAEAMRDEKVRVLRSMSPVQPGDAVRGQFHGYRSLPGVSPDSSTETFVALRAEIDSWRWAGVPFYIRAGKELAETVTEILVEFKRPPRVFFTQSDTPLPHPNHLLFRVKPGEKVSISAQIKSPGDQLVSRPVDLDYSYDEHREGARDDAYARLLDDALDGDQRLFARFDSVEVAWQVVDPLVQAPPPVEAYQPGSWGPAAAESIVPGGWHLPDLGGGAT